MLSKLAASSKRAHSSFFNHQNQAVGSPQAMSTQRYSTRHQRGTDFVAGTGWGQHRVLGKKLDWQITDTDTFKCTKRAQVGQDNFGYEKRKCSPSSLQATGLAAVHRRLAQHRPGGLLVMIKCCSKEDCSRRFTAIPGQRKRRQKMKVEIQEVRETNASVKHETQSSVSKMCSAGAIKAENDLSANSGLQSKPQINLRLTMCPL